MIYTDDEEKIVDNKFRLFLDRSKTIEEKVKLCRAFLKKYEDNTSAFPNRMVLLTKENTMEYNTSAEILYMRRLTLSEVLQQQEELMRNMYMDMYPKIIADGGMAVDTSFNHINDSKIIQIRMAVVKRSVIDR